MAASRNLDFTDARECAPGPQGEGAAALAAAFRGVVGMRASS
jgi:hypothetical protein